MAEIKKEDLRRVFGAYEPERFQQAQVSLFIISSKYPRLKKLDLDGLSSEKRAEKLQKWGNEHRFVAVIQIGDQVFAHASAKFAEQLEKQKDLTIDGKNVSIKTLTDEESDLLAAVGEAYESHVLIPEEKKESDSKNVSQGPSKNSTTTANRQYYALRNLVSDETLANHWILRIAKIPGQIILTALQRMNEARREDDKIAEKQEQHQEILRQAIKKDILSGEIKTGEIKNQELKKSEIGKDSKRTKFARGIKINS